MAIYLTISSISAIFALLFAKGDHRTFDKKHKFFNFCLFLLMFVLVFIQTFRSVNVGGDLHDSYYDLYQFVGENKWNFVINSSSGYEIGYLALNKLVYWISGGRITVLLFVIALVYLSSLYHFIKKISPNRFLSIFLFLAFGIYNTSMNNLRSTFALALVLFTLCFYIDKKWFRALFFIIIGMLFHKTVIIFLLFFLLASIKSNKLFGFFCVLLVLVFTLGFQMFAGAILTFFPRYEAYFTLQNSGGGYGLMALLIAIVIGMLMVTKKSFWKDRSNLMFFKMLIFAIVLQFVSLRISYFSRAVFYFLYAIIVLFPLIFNEFKNKTFKRFAYIVLILGMTAFFIYVLVGDASSTVPYELIFGSTKL